MKKYLFFLIILSFIGGCNPEPEDLNIDNQVDRSTSSISSTSARVGVNNLSVSSVPQSFYAFYKGRSSNHVFYSKSQNGTSWTGDVYIPGGTDRTPAATYFKGKLYVFYKGTSTDRVYYTSSSDGINWATSRDLGHNQSTRIAPATVVFNDKLWIFYVGSTSGHIWVSYSSDGSKWEGNYTITGDVVQFMSEDRIGACTFNNKIYLFYAQKGTSGAVTYITSTTGLEKSYSSPSIVPGANAHSGISAVPYDDYIYVVYESGISHSNLDWVKVYNNGGTDHGVIQVNGGNARTDTTPSVATDGSKLVVVFQELNGNRNYYVYSNDGNSWYGNTTALGSTNEGLAVTYTK